MPPEPDVLLGATVIVLALASIGTWFFLLDRLSRGPILPFESRQPVPWHGVWTLLPVLLVVLTLAAAVMERGAAPDVANATATDLVERIAFGSAQQLALVFVVMAVMIAVSRANFTDLGLPKDRGELLRDVRIGVIAWLAALVPVYSLQFVLIHMIGQTEGHPLIKMVEEQANPVLFLLAFSAAVIVAPLCEELLFRLVLQGWLEKWEDRREKMTNDECQMTNEAALQSEDLSFEIQNLKLSDGNSPQNGLFGLPHGWLPIGASSLLFALAHVGYGPDPIPLFLLALILGYTYQRTHRILPSMITHALFNAMSLFALWRVMSAGGP